ncbi:MAG: SHOCT domain-containing protein [Lachnospiraceae bacterium]|nr:SHOCT domain-containing protein [Lachnospiraceae bacterium]
MSNKKKGFKIANVIIYAICAVAMFIPNMFSLRIYEAEMGTFSPVFSLKRAELISAESFTNTSHYTFGDISSFRSMTNFFVFFLLICFIGSAVLYFISMNKENISKLCAGLSAVALVMFFIFQYNVSTALDGRGDPSEYDFHCDFENAIGVYLVIILLLVALVFGCIIAFSKDSVPINQSSTSEGMNYNQSGNILSNGNEADVPAELRKYKQLLDDGLITQEDFDKKKSELLIR